MLFNSIEFIVFFLPITLFVYFLLNKNKLVELAKGWLVITSLFFYAYWKLEYLPLILISMVFNYTVGISLTKYSNLKINKKLLFSIGILGNILLLGYFKYFDFLIFNINALLKTDCNYLNIILPLGISFFTFTQIAYLVDAYKMKVKEFDFLNYALFVTFFPHLIAGPILHHSEMMPQFENLKNKVFNYKNFYYGIILFTIGLFKKVIIADNLSPLVHQGFDLSTTLTFLDSWLTSLAYTFQLFFDFSGYTDMALGIAMMFNIFLPINFNQPYKATNIQDFWRRWHMTLSRFLRDYIYIPLGGNKNFHLRNLFLTFIIGGLWHGAAWTFLIWGAVHGIGMIFHNLWKKFEFQIPRFIAVVVTFLFINASWVVFRAKNFTDALKIYKGMFGLNGFEFPEIYHGTIRYSGSIDISSFMVQFLIIILCFVIIINFKTAKEVAMNLNPNLSLNYALPIFFCWLLLNLSKISEFLYFNF